MQLQQDEREFLLKQSVARADIRLKENRPKLIDLVIGNLYSRNYFVKLSDPADFLLHNWRRDTEFCLQVDSLCQIDLNMQEFWCTLLSFIRCSESENNFNVCADIVEKVESLLTDVSSADLDEVLQLTNEKLALPLADFDFWEFFKYAVTTRLSRLAINHRLSSPTTSHSHIISQEQFTKSFNSAIAKNQQKHVKKEPSKPATDKFTFYDNCPQAKQLLHKETSKKLSEDEQVIDIELELENIRYPFANPIKPRYFAKVRSAYEWNKYNQTHFSIDNPPPKTIMGYEFHVFYPQLKNPTKTPQFKVSKKGPDFVLIFTSSEPYTDLAFKIISDDWDTSARHGFRCFFENGVLFLKFNMKRLHLHQ